MPVTVKGWYYISKPVKVKEKSPGKEKILLGIDRKLLAMTKDDKRNTARRVLWAPKEFFIFFKKKKKKRTNKV